MCSEPLNVNISVSPRWQFWILTKVYFLLYIQMTVIFIGKTCNVFRNPPPTIMQLITALITYHVMSGSKAK